MNSTSTALTGTYGRGGNERSVTIAVSGRTSRIIPLNDGGQDFGIVSDDQKLASVHFAENGATFIHVRQLSSDIQTHQVNPDHDLYVQVDGRTVVAGTTPGNRLRLINLTD